MERNQRKTLVGRVVSTKRFRLVEVVEEAVII